MSCPRRSLESLSFSNVCSVSLTLARGLSLRLSLSAKRTCVAMHVIMVMTWWIVFSWANLLHMYNWASGLVHLSLSTNRFRTSWSNFVDLLRKGLSLVTRRQRSFESSSKKRACPALAVNTIFGQGSTCQRAVSPSAHAQFSSRQNSPMCNRVEQVDAHVQLRTKSCFLQIFLVFFPRLDCNETYPRFPWRLFPSFVENIPSLRFHVCGVKGSFLVFFPFCASIQAQHARVRPATHNQLVVHWHVKSCIHPAEDEPGLAVRRRDRFDSWKKFTKPTPVDFM